MKTMVSAQLSDAFCGAVIGIGEVYFQCKQCRSSYTEKSMSDIDLYNDGKCMNCAGKLFVKHSRQ